jgi:hypothetical protein
MGSSATNGLRHLKQLLENQGSERATTLLGFILVDVMDVLERADRNERPSFWLRSRSSGGARHLLDSNPRLASQRRGS